jgi:hypothetical protein
VNDAGPASSTGALRARGALKALWGSLQIAHGIGELISHRGDYGTWRYYLWCAYLLLSVGAFVYGMTGLCEALSGTPIRQLDLLWLRLDRRPLMKCLLSLAVFAVLNLYIAASIMWLAVLASLGICDPFG